MMKLLFCDPDAWAGGFFELALELGARSDERLRAALCQVWEHPTLSGCYLRTDVEPTAQARVSSNAVDLQQTAYGIADIPGIGKTCCATFVVREDDGPDWLVIGVPMGSLSRVLRVGAYPFEDGTDLSWRRTMQAWLRQVAESLFESVPFQLGLIEHNVSGDTYAADVRREGVPSKRWFGYLWPGNEGLHWYAPTEGAPFSVGGDERIMTRTKRRIRGFIALAASAAIAAMIHYGFASPYPQLKIAYTICVGAALWGLIDIVRSLAES